MNSIQIKKVKQSINRLQEQNILQDQKIDELARYLNLTANRVKLHDEQIYSLQVEMVRLNSGLRGLIAITNYHLYTYYLMNMAQLTVFRLMVGLSDLEKNIDRIDEYLRVMTTHKATPVVIPPNALRRLLGKVMRQLRPNPRLRIPYDPSGRDIWKYYDNIQIYPVLSDNMLVILLTIPLLDTTLELNIYRLHNLPAIPPGHHLAATYQLEGEYFAVGKHGSYVALPDRDAVIRCINTRLAVCQLDRALYPVGVVRWCVYALYIQDEDRIRRDCRYDIINVEQNLAKSLGGYLWAISAVAAETLQIRCLLETSVVPIQPPLQIVYVGDGCEGYSPSLFIPAKTDRAVTVEIKPRKHYFMEFNEIYEPNTYLGIWYQFKLTLMNPEEAKKLVKKAESFGTLDFSILNKHIQPIPRQEGGGFPVPPMVLVVGVGFTLTLVAGILLACKLRQVGLTASALTATANTVVEKIPLNRFRNLFQKATRRENKRTPAQSTVPVPVPTTPALEPTVPAPSPVSAPHVEVPELSNLIRGAFVSERDARRYAKHLEWKGMTKVSVHRVSSGNRGNDTEIRGTVR